MSVSKEAIAAVAAMKALNLRNASEEEIRQALQMVNNTALMTSDFPQGASIARTRCVQDFMGSNVYREQDISVNPDPTQVGVGRAHLAGQPVFYGVSMVGANGTVLPRVVSYSETSTLTSDRSDSESEEYVITGRWRAVEPFKVVWFVHHADFKQPDIHIAQLREGYKNVAGHLENYDNCVYINEALAAEFAKEVPMGEGYAYGFTSVIGKYLLEEYRCDAIGFPSVKAEGNGMNLAIHPRVLASGKMKLEVVIVEKAYKFGRQFINSPYMVCNKFRPDGSFIYEEVEGHTKEELKQVLISKGYTLH